MIFDAVSGAQIAENFGVEGPYGIVDGRNGAVVDLNTDEHEVAITMIGSYNPNILEGNMGRSGPGYGGNEG